MMCDDEGEADKAKKVKKANQSLTTKGEASYEVGHKKPPKEFQFKTGQSGNPKGRPKGSTSFKAKVQKELEKKVTVKKDGKPVKMSKLDIGVKRLVDGFATGDPKSTAIIIDLDKKNEKPKAGEDAADDVVLPDEANLEFILERLKGLVKEGKGGSSDE
jgi:hypothetical protein